MDIFSIKQFQFPYEDLHFPGQHSEEKILFVTREGKIVLDLKLLFLLLTVLVGVIITVLVFSRLKLFGFSFAFLTPFILILWLLAGLFIAWWIYSVYQRTLFIITTRRLTKFIHTTPWSRYQLSLGLDKIVDTGAYQKGWFQIVAGLGYFVARSSAGAIKNFKIINISFAEDLHNYVNKVLYVFNEKQDQLDQFRPFIPHLKGEARDNYVRKVAPKYGKPLK
ncbi:hypothetical protein GYA19_05895 [Candidatus Beckwithbacteria bacterium]|nr:hypothetical protein [Candidatus Beckwithbacteria bacterium]